MALRQLLAGDVSRSCMAPVVSILVVLGTRPEAIKLAPVIAAMRADPRFRVRVCATGQHRGLLDQVTAIMGIAPDHDLDLMRAGQSLDALAGALLPAIGAVIDADLPDRVMVQGDTTSTLCGALSAHHRRLPVDHVEAGLRSHDLLHPWPEEGNRRIVGSLASLHFAPTQAAAAALRAEGVDGARIHLTGNTAIDALRTIAGYKPPSGDDPLGALLVRFASRRLLVVTCHRRENLGGGIVRIAAAIAQIAARPDVAVIYPLHPNPAIRATMIAGLGSCANVALIDPLGYPDFVRLLSAASLVLTDSGGVQEEAPAFGKPVLVLRDTTERGEAVAAGTARLVGTDTDRIVAETMRLLDDPDAYAAMARSHLPFGDGHAAARIVGIIAREADRLAERQMPAYH